MPEPEAKPASLSTLVGLLEVAFASCTASIDEMVYSSSSKAHVACMVHYLHATKNAKACVALAKSGDFCAIPIVLRAVVESAASLRNLSKSADYVEMLWNDSMLRYRDDVKRFSQYVPSVVRSEARDEASKIITEIEAIQAAPERSHRKRINQSEKFRDAEMVDHYVLLYSSFSGITHGNLLSLFQEHTVIENGTIIVVDQDIKSSEELFYLCDTLLSSTYAVVECAYSILGIDAKERLVELEHVIDEFQSIFIKPNG